MYFISIRGHFTVMARRQIYFSFYVLISDFQWVTKDK
uniref:Uncharacterized protein n=1 Tax=Anguilla anguilla TaxID=7936 RepID=A0A0E9RB17_ANGAN